MKQRWQLCQAIEAAGGLKPDNWLWLNSPAEFPEHLALVLEPGCGPLEQMVARLKGRNLRLLRHPLQPRQRCLPAPFDPPGDQDWLLLVGEVAGPNLWEARALYGQRIAITREASQAEVLHNRLLELGAEVILCPVLEFVAPDSSAELHHSLEHIQDYDWVIFTSPNGVRYFFEALARVGDGRLLAKAKLAVIGPGTAAALESQGLRADLMPIRSIAEGLVEAFLSIPLQGCRVLLPRAQEARPILPEQLTARGAQVDVVACYQTILPAPPAHLEWVDRVVLMSASAVRHFRQIWTHPRLPQAVCIGPITAQQAREVGFTDIVEAHQFNLEGVVEALLA